MLSPLDMDWNAEACVVVGLGDWSFDGVVFILRDSGNGSTVVDLVFLFRFSLAILDDGGNTGWIGIGWIGIGRIGLKVDVFAWLLCPPNPRLSDEFSSATGKTTEASVIGKVDTGNPWGCGGCGGCGSIGSDPDSRSSSIDEFVTNCKEK